MDYQEIVEIIENKRRFGKKCGRDIMIEALEKMGHPEHGMRVIHIAGTNGKGSTAAAVDRMLRSLGFTVGLFTSPHLIRFTERIQINGEEISQEDVVRLGQEVLAVDVDSTMFDDSLMMAILYFQEKKCDYVILETGLGGKLDSTAGLDLVPEVSIITRIGLDHVQILGNTIGEIAEEKAGILKPGTRLVLAENDAEALDVILGRARQLHIPVVESNSKTMEHMSLHLMGKYQKENMATAAAAVNCLAFRDRDLFLQKIHKGHVMSSEEFHLRILTGIKDGIRRVSWPGRMEIISRKPFLMVDGAHNPQGVNALHDSLLEMYGEGPYHFVMGVLADKDYHRMIQTMYPIAASFRTVTVENKRALQGDKLASLIQGDGVEASAYTNLKAALEDAMKEAEEKGEKTIAFGSLYFIGEILKLWQN